VQAQAAERVTPGAIAFVTGYRAARSGQLGANLVPAPGLQRQLDQ